MWWIIFPVLGVLVLITYIILKIKAPQIRGNAGENLVHRRLKRLAKDGAVVETDYMFMGDVRSVQIDHIYIDAHAVYVIETKNYSGEIFGDDIGESWTQVLAGGNVKNKLHSPVKQNAGHIYQLSKLLPKGTPVEGLVVLVQNNTQRVRASGVIGLKDLKKVIKRNLYDVNLSPADIKRIHEILLSSEADDVTRRQHIADIKKMIEGVESNSICPRCGGALVLRDGKYGPFYGCSKYPKCKFTKNV